MSTTPRVVPVPITAAIYAHETTQLSAIALALVGFAAQVRLGEAAAAQRRDLRASAAKTRLHVSIAGSACSAKRRRIWYQRAQERVASFAFVLLDLQHGAQIAPEDFDVGRALAARGKALLDAQLAALGTMAREDQDDVAKLDELLLAADRAEKTGPQLDDGRASTAAAPTARHQEAATPAPDVAQIGKNVGISRASLGSPAPDRRSTRA